MIALGGGGGLLYSHSAEVWWITCQISSISVSAKISQSMDNFLRVYNILEFKQYKLYI